MTWFIIAPDQRTAHNWLRDQHPDVDPRGRQIRIFTPAVPDRVRGYCFHEGDRLIRLNNRWLGSSPETRRLNDYIAIMQAVSGIDIQEEWVSW